MSRLLRRSGDLRAWQPWLIGAPVALVALLLLRAVLMPDAAASHFYRAQRLQAAGQEQQALRLYSLIAQTQPQSSYAPLALQQEGEILTALARRSGDAKLFRAAIDSYARLATEYSSHSSAGEALLAAGGIALNDLRDIKAAARFYKLLRENYAGNAEYSSEATLRLGRIALQDGDAKTAQKFFGQVIKEFARFPDRCAEAQYHTGVTLETLLKNPTAARAAYEVTIKKWPRSVWAGDAKERLGMMSYNPAARPARRVLIEVAALPKTFGDGREAALHLMLASRGLEISEATWRGWSLSPFRAAFAPRDPGRVLETRGDWETVAANAGLEYSRRNERDAPRALNLLRDELDAGRAPLLNAGGWMMIVGYDSSRDEFFARYEGARLETLPAKELVNRWRAGGEYSLITFRAPGEHPKAEVEKTGSPPDAPNLLAPVYLYKLPRLSLSDAHRRTLRRAAQLMKRPREAGVLLNLEALRALKNELETLAHAPASPVPAPEAANADDDDSTAPDATSTPAPAATPQTTPVPRIASSVNVSARWKNLRKWFGAPLQNWVEARRDAAAFCDDARSRTAAAAWRGSIAALENAASTLPSENAFEADPEAAREAMQVLAGQIKAALQAESRATAAMS